MKAKTLRLARILRLAAPFCVILPLIAATAARAQTYTLTTVANFNGSGNGSTPNGGLTLDASGNLYGTASGGGANNDGTVFKISAGTSTLSTIAAFGGANGADPAGGVAFDSSGNLYGTAQEGGNLSVNGGVGYGDVFKVAAGTNALTAVATFNGSNGLFPGGGVAVDQNGNLYGTTEGNASTNDGSLFKIASGANTVTTLATFSQQTTGESPLGDVTLDSNGNLYGTAYAFGPGGAGDVFKYKASTGVLSVLAAFNGANGDGPESSVVFDSSGNIYGTTQTGGNLALNSGYGYGTVFKIAAGTNAITTIASFDGSNGNYPDSPLTIDSSGNLYGTTIAGGASGDGTVFKIAAGSNVLTTIATFNSANGSGPIGNLTLDSSGNFYGTTSGGGANNDGTVFKLSLNASGAAPEPGALALLLPFGVPAALGIARRRKYALRVNLNRA